MSSAIIRVLVQLVSSKQGRGMIVNVLLGIFLIFLLPMFLIGGALSSVSDMVMDDTDIFATCKNEVREEMDISNDLDPLFVRWLFLSNNDENELPNEQAIKFIIKIFFVESINNGEETTFRFRSERQIFLLFESPDVEMPAEQIAELKDLIALRDDMKSENRKLKIQ